MDAETVDYRLSTREALLNPSSSLRHLAHEFFAVAESQAGAEEQAAALARFRRSARELVSAMRVPTAVRKRCTRDREAYQELVADIEEKKKAQVETLERLKSDLTDARRFRAERDECEARARQVIKEPEPSVLEAQRQEIASVVEELKARLGHADSILERRRSQFLGLLRALHDLRSVLADETAADAEAAGGALQAAAADADEEEDVDGEGDGEGKGLSATKRARTDADDDADVAGSEGDGREDGEV